MALPTILPGISSVFIKDRFEEDFRTQIYIDCPNRRAPKLPNSVFTPVKAMLVNEVTIKVSSKWESPGNILPGPVKKIVDPDEVDKLTQIFTGSSIKQPYFARRIWKGNEPLAISLTFKFLSQRNAEDEVLKPLNNLLSLAYPRKSGVSETLPIPQEISSLLDLYVIPGPSLLYPLALATGDYLDLYVGENWYWTACFITELNVKLSPSVDTDGYPNYVECAVTLGTLDTQFVGKDGSFNVFRQDYSYFKDELRQAAISAQEEAKSTMEKMMTTMFGGT